MLGMSRRAESPAGHHEEVGTVSILEREIYSEPEAARLLGVPQATLHWWLDGGQRRSKTYAPVIRTQPTGSKAVSWGEFVEAGLLRQYRREHLVPLREIRSFIQTLRDRLDVPYPLAHAKPFVGEGRRLLLDAQNEAEVPGDFSLVAEASGQLLLTPAAHSFFTRVEWDDDMAAQWRPHDDPLSPVRMDPRVRFGRPSIGGISTEVLWEQVEDGAGFDEIAEDFSLPAASVRWAWSYENSARAA
jgi:uncharacterized protein (DUF433 family)